MKVKAITEFSYDLIDRKAGDVFDMNDAHAFALKTLGKVVKAEDDEESKPTTKGNRYKRRDMRAEG